MKRLSLSPQDFAERIGVSLDELDRVETLASGWDAPQAESVKALTTSMRSTLHLMAALGSSTLGECRVTTPFAAIQPIIDSGGRFKWCCSHSPQHCAV